MLSVLSGLASVVTKVRNARAELNQILFGVNQTIACQMPSSIINIQTLSKSICSTIQTKLKDLPIANSIDLNTQFGVFGNPHPKKANDWISLSSVLDFSTVTSIYELNSCQVMSGISLNFYYSYIMSQGQKQYYIQKIDTSPIYKKVIPKI
jgi:hypothetical protein